jgi:MOSC domain-containing protein YiiM
MIVDQQGIVDDKFYAKDINRSVLISSIESYNMAKSIGIDLEIGKLGENILINYNPYDLEAGTQIEIGEVILEINQRCTLCKSLTKIDNKLPKLLKDDRGIFSRVIKSGTIKIEDKIYII